MCPKRKGESMTESKYHLRAKTGRRKQFGRRDNGRWKWLKMRHRMKKRVLR